MADCVDVKSIVKHIANSTLEDNLCIICLGPLGEEFESIFTKVCKEDKEYCIADVLGKICQSKFTDEGKYNTCIDCFMRASIAYKFFLQAKQSEEIIEFYTNELLNNVASADITENSSNKLCVLPILSVESDFDFDLKGIGKWSQEESTNEIQATKSIEVKREDPNLDDENIVMVVSDDGEQKFFKIKNGDIFPLDASEMKECNKAFEESVPVDKKKKRRKRDPMIYRSCPKCPVKYRFLTRLKEHVKFEHNMDLFICKVCKETTCNEEEYNNHIKTHTGVHECDVCNTVFKKCDTMLLHKKRHREMNNLSQIEGAHICEVCGVVLENEQKLKEHSESKHVKKFTCFYCGKMYRGENSFEMHIKKHEMYISREKSKSTESKVLPKIQKPESNKRKSMCTTCGKYFVDERALLWHRRLHSNERPYICEVCGRGFVTVNRRNQHAVCAHSAPARRCPLCPALFHLRSMVNSHIKKVHLKAHKRRYRPTKHQNVFWRTETVPIEELSISIQSDTLELKAAKEKEIKWVIHSKGAMDFESMLQS